MFIPELSGAKAKTMTRPKSKAGKDAPVGVRHSPFRDINPYDKVSKLALDI